MRTILKKFLEKEISFEYINEDFDYEFDKHCNGELFDIEFKKFLSFYNSVFYHDNRFVTIFNSNEIRIKKCDLEAIFSLYFYTEENDLKYQKCLIQDFLYTYQITINTNEYRDNYTKFQESKDEFNDVVNSLNIRKKFFTDIPNNLYIFYKELICFGLVEDIFIDGETISKIFNNLKFAKKNYDELINIFIAEKKNIYSVIKFDKEKDKHISTYIEYIEDSLDEFGGYNYAKEIMFELDKDKCLNEDIVNKIINKYICITNKLVNKLKNKDYSFIKGLSEIDGLKKEFMYLLKNIESFNNLQKDKIKECLSKLLKVKRFIVSDDEYVKSEMHESKYEQKIPKEEVESYRDSLMENTLRLYNASRVKFTKEMGQALEMYANYPITSMVSRFTIDSRREIYALCIEDRKKQANDNFKKYFDTIGKEYTESHPDLLNKLNSNYYEELLKHLSTTFNLHQSLLLSMISKQDFDDLIKQLKESIGYTFENQYAMVVSNILAIEVNVVKILEKYNVEVSKDGFTNLNNLFEICKDNEENVNGLMYLNYILYEKSGMNLRNNAMHGTLINESLIIPLIVSFSGLIFISWLLKKEIE